MQIIPPPAWKEVAGIFAGGCVERGEGSSFRKRAHAHNDQTDKYFGWICVRTTPATKLAQERIGTTVANNDGTVELTAPSETMWHEYAHILTPNHWHDDFWRAKMKELNQSLPARYEKKLRGKRCRYKLLDTRRFSDEVIELSKCLDCGRKKTIHYEKSYWDETHGSAL